ncbi:unnamed protein product, partial [Porites evermanni]
LNYGSLATVIGHEITHGFDDSGRLYDKNGNFNDWWSEESEANFKSKSDCLVDQYGDYKVFGKKTPFYTKNYPKYLNYGSLATVIGHEITHGFDDSGRLYDKNGNFNDWWSEESEANFKSKSDCLVDQYGDYKVFGKKIDGKQTLGENIADNGGLKLAYEAYQSWVKANGRENPLPDLSMSVDQLFFIGFAMTHCAVYKKKAALYQREIDSHSYDKYRSIFAKAFNCPIGSEMNPVKKCSVW